MASEKDFTSAYGTLWMSLYCSGAMSLLLFFPLTFSFEILFLLISLYSFGSVSLALNVGIFILLFLGMIRIPNTFTLGEALLLSQGITLTLVDFFVHFYERQILTSHRTENPSQLSDSDSVMAVVQVAGVGIVLLGVGMFPVLKQLQLNTQKVVPNLIFYLGSLGLFWVISFPWALWRLHLPFWEWLWEFLSSPLRRLLLAYWFGVFSLGILGMGTLGKLTLGGHVTVQRKYFHLLSVLLFLPGLLVDPSLLRLALGAAGTLLSFLELCRGRVWPLGTFLESSTKVFRDSKDEGDVLLLSPLTLLLGCAVPLWLSSHVSQDPPLPMYAGVLSLGIADSVASLVGTFYGQTKWPNCSKTLEGSLGAFLGLTLSTFGIILGKGMTLTWAQYVGIVGTSALVSVLEGVTSQSDNVILPLYLYSLWTLLLY